MGALSSKLRSRAGDGISYWCPGCDEPHGITVNQDSWTWDGNADAPTITPSIKVTSGHYMPGFVPGSSCWCTYNQAQIAAGKKPSPFECSCCHCFIKAGQIEFLSDCTHKLKGQTVPLPDWPGVDDNA